MDEQDPIKIHNKESLIIDNIDTFVLRYPQHYQPFLVKALNEGMSIEDALEYLKDFNL
jgi:hypothetical protein